MITVIVLPITLPKLFLAFVGFNSKICGKKAVQLFAVKCERLKDSNTNVYYGSCSVQLRFISLLVRHC